MVLAHPHRKRVAGLYFRLTSRTRLGDPLLFAYASKWTHDRLFPGGSLRRRFTLSGFGFASFTHFRHCGIDKQIVCWNTQLWLEKVRSRLSRYVASECRPWSLTGSSTNLVVVPLWYINNGASTPSRGKHSNLFWRNSFAALSALFALPVLNWNSMASCPRRKNHIRIWQ